MLLLQIIRQKLVVGLLMLGELFAKTLFGVRLRLNMVMPLQRTRHRADNGRVLSSI